MSQGATLWAMQQDVAPVSKLVLWVFADNAAEDGLATWATPDMMSTVVSRTTPATMREHVGKLLEEGYIREGDQDRISPEWKKTPRNYRPIVYDLALNEDIRQQWKAAYDPGAGRRGAAVTAGRKAGRASAASRAASSAGDVQCRENRHWTSAQCQENQHGTLAEPDTGPVSGKPPGSVGNPDTLIRTEDSLTQTREQEGGGNPPSPHLGLSTQSGPAGAQVRLPSDGTLVDEVLARRPGWTRAAVRAALSASEVAAADPALVRRTILELAADQGTWAPGRLSHVLAAARAAAAPSSPAPRAGQPLPVGWQPSGELLSWAADQFPIVDVTTATAGFRAHYHANQASKPDWDGQWQLWITREARFQSEPGGREQAPPGWLRPPGQSRQPQRSVPSLPAVTERSGLPEDYEPGAMGDTAVTAIAEAKAKLASRHGTVFRTQRGGVPLIPPALPAGGSQPVSPQAETVPSRPAPGAPGATESAERR